MVAKFIKIKTELFGSRFLGRLFNIFRETPTWAELTSSFGISLYLMIAVINGLDDAGMHRWPSLRLISELMPESAWIVVTFFALVAQLGSILANMRTARLVAAGFAFVWYIFVIMMSLPISGLSPMLGFPLAMCAPNLFSIARHSRDWNVRLAPIVA